MFNNSRFFLKITTLALMFFVPISCNGRGLLRRHAAVTSNAEKSIMVDGLERTFLVHKGKSCNSQKAPLIMALHGGMGNANFMMTKVTSLNNFADKHGFIVVYPNGTGGRFRRLANKRTWNAGECCGMAVKKNVDDVKFLSLLIDKMIKEYGADKERVYITGMSNGAMMAYRMMCEASEKITAIIPVSGTLALDQCPDGRNVKVFHIHGDSDTNVPFIGGSGLRSVSGHSHKSVPETIREISKNRQCYEDSILQIGRNTMRVKHCENGGDISLLIIKNGGHCWPGSQRCSSEVSAEKVLWKFINNAYDKDN